MKNQQYKKYYYHLRHRLLTTNNLVIVIAFFVALSWAWGSVNMLQRNFALQREVDAKKRQLTLTELEVNTQRFQQAYYKSDEYKELAVRQRLGLVFPGEKVLILPPNTPEAAQSDASLRKKATLVSQPTNVEQWTNFLFGNNNRE